jgi:oxygen-independent coproporphyrinogen-3 oxidase
MLKALRLVEGFTLADFERTTSQPAAAVRPTLEALSERGLVGERDGLFRPTPTGFRFLNELIGAFLPEENHRPGHGELYTAPSRFVSERDFRDIVSEVP